MMSSGLMVSVVEKIVILRPAVLVTVVLTLVAYVAMMISIRKLKVQGRRNKVAGLFIGLGGRSLLHLGFCWMKYAFTVSCLVLRQPLEITHYLLLSMMIVFALLCGPSIKGIVNEIIGGGMLMIGLVACSTLLRYLMQIRFVVSIFAAYWLLAIFLILCATAIFFREVTVISQERKYFDENGETE